MARASRTYRDHAGSINQRRARQRGDVPGVQGGELQDPEGEQGLFVEGWGSSMRNHDGSKIRTKEEFGRTDRTLLTAA